MYLDMENLIEVTSKVEKFNASQDEKYMIIDRVGKTAVLAKYNLTSNCELENDWELISVDGEVGYICELDLECEDDVHVHKTVELFSNYPNVNYVQKYLVDTKIDSGLIVVKEKLPQLAKFKGMPHLIIKPYYQTIVTVDSSYINKLKVISPFANIDCDIKYKFIIDNKVQK